MKTKLFCATLVLLLGMGVSSSYAQISEGTPTHKTFRTGNRPEQGVWGLFFGVNFLSPEIVCGNKPDEFITPVVNLKYFATDRLEIRAGIEAMKEYDREKRLLKDEEGAVPQKFRDSYSRVALYPGVAYHFSPKNILDVYVGGELPIGYNAFGGADAKTVVPEDPKLDPYDLTRVYHHTGFNIGLTAFVGLQVFIADLPIAVGVEYGIGSYFNFGERVKVTTTEGKNEPVVKYYPVNVSSSTGYDKYSASNGAISDHVRLTFTYYFK